jgi:hypothetical protein
VLVRVRLFLRLEGPRVFLSGPPHRFQARHADKSISCGSPDFMPYPRDLTTLAYVVSHQGFALRIALEESYTLYETRNFIEFTTRARSRFSHVRPLDICSETNVVS